MLRNRSRAVTSKQALMSDHTSVVHIASSPISSFLSSPRFFNGFLSKSLSDSAEPSAMSPTSILDLKNSSSFVNPFGYDRNLSKPPIPSPETNNNAKPGATGALGLALIDSIIEEKVEESNGSFFRPINRAILFGSKLKVQIPEINLPPSLPHLEILSPGSPTDFGIKTRGSQFLSPVSGNPSREFNRQLSLKEMELSEDYTCVTTHGPNPKTTHIFDDCIVECCCGDDTGFFGHKETAEFGFEGNVSASSSAGFLSFCHTCRDALGKDKDIYMYRGEKAFCSHECRTQEIFLERMENQESEDVF